MLDAFEDITDNLPVLETYVTIFGSTELEFLRKPLTLLYADLMAFGIKAVKLLDRGKMSMHPSAPVITLCQSPHGGIHERMLIRP